MVEKDHVVDKEDEAGVDDSVFDWSVLLSQGHVVNMVEKDHVVDGEDESEADGGARDKVE